MNQTVLKAAMLLADALEQSAECKRMRAAEEASLQDNALAALFAEYQEKSSEIRDMTCAEAPDHALIAAAVRELDDIQERIAMNPAAKEAREAKSAYQEMMREVSVILGQESGCSGGCEGCQGCEK